MRAALLFAALSGLLLALAAAQSPPPYACAADANCKACVAGSTTTCQKCQNGFFLLAGRCVASCNGTGAFAFHNTRTAGIGYRCVRDFVCDENLDGQCLCPNVETGARCKTCRVLAVNESAAAFECLACNDPTVLLVQGRCSEALSCRNGFFVDKLRPNVLTNVTCDCGITTPSCQECLLNYNTTRLGPNTCVRCKDSRYFLNGRCGNATLCASAGLVPAQTTGLGTVGRSCVRPFHCVGGRNVEFGGAACVCPTPKYCASCVFNATVACTACTAPSMLVRGQGVCALECPAGTAPNLARTQCL